MKRPRDRDKEAKHRLYLEEEIRAQFGNIVGDSPALKTTLDLVAIVAPTDSSVLIVGETGTGKELIARAIHNLSSRRGRAFVKLNCAAIPLGLLESELFGHEKGAFTGAIAQKTGRFELANKGTLFLDEVGDIPLELQGKIASRSPGTGIRETRQQPHPQGERAPYRSYPSRFSRDGQTVNVS